MSIDTRAMFYHVPSQHHETRNKAERPWFASDSLEGDALFRQGKEYDPSIAVAAPKKGGLTQRVTHVLGKSSLPSSVSPLDPTPSVDRSSLQHEVVVWSPETVVVPCWRAGELKVNVNFLSLASITPKEKEISTWPPPLIASPTFFARSTSRRENRCRP